MIKAISRKELRDKIDRGDRFELVETLPETAFQHIHLPGAVNLPPDKIRDVAPSLLPDKSAEIVVYCGNTT